MEADKLAGRQPERNELIVLGGSGATFLLSFFSWSARGPSSTPWSTGFLSLMSLIPLVALAVCVITILRVFTDVQLPERVLGFSAPQQLVVLALWPPIVLVTIPLRDEVGSDLGTMFWLATIASITAAVGAVLELSGPARTSPAPPQSF